MSRGKELADAIRRKIRPGSNYVCIGREMARELIKELEGKDHDRINTSAGKAGEGTANSCGEVGRAWKPDQGSKPESPGKNRHVRGSLSMAESACYVRALRGRSGEV